MIRKARVFTGGRIRTKKILSLKFSIAKNIEDFSAGPSIDSPESFLYPINNFSANVNKKVKDFPNLITNYMKFIKNLFDFFCNM